MKTKKKIASVVLSMVLAFGGAIVIAPAASALGAPLPSGCSLSPVAPKLSGSKIKFSGTGYCTSSYVQYYRTNLYHYWKSLPDVSVTSGTDHTGPNYSYGSSTCDNGGTADYYTQAAFVLGVDHGGDTYANSAVKSLTHC